MPKELTHHIIAETAKKTYSKKNPQSSLIKILEIHRDYFLFGAIIHDVAFCGSKSEQGEKLKEKGRAVHGNPPNDNIRPFRYLAEEYDRKGEPEILSIIAGAVTHMVADYVFHPFVYYYSGDEIDRHFRLETLIDTHLSHRQDHFLERPVHPPHLYRNLKKNLDYLSIHVAGFLGLPESFTPEILKALKLHALTLVLFRSRPALQLYRVMLSIRSKEEKHKAHLFYPPRMRFNTSFFDREFFFRHPLTGDAQTVHLTQLIETAAQKACDIFENIDAAADSRTLLLFFETIPPVSLETGLDPFKGRKFHYTDLSRTINRLVSGE